MVVALAHAELGPGLQAFGDSGDGGREAICEVPIDWSKTVLGTSGTWTGKTVFQAKFQVKPLPSPHDNAVWLQNAIGAEIRSWITAKRNNQRAWYPDYIVFVTNIDLSPLPKAGGIDALDTYITNRIGPGSDAQQHGLFIKDYRIWHADEIRSLLDANQGVRWAYPGLLSVGDILSLLNVGSTPWGSFGLSDPLRDEMLRSLQSDQWIRLGQAGASAEEKLKLHDVLIDLPVTHDDRGDSHAIKQVLEVGDRNLRQREPDKEGHPGLVFVGGPGQGKSTLSQAVAQAYRTALLDGADLASTPSGIIDSTKATLKSLGIGVPGNRRWPVRVDLAKYAEELASGSQTTLLRWIATELNKRIESDITPSQLRQWLGAWPWALILDGLDEVPTSESRRLLRTQIDDLLVTSEDVNADLLLLVTSRPTGDERFASDYYQHWSLEHLPPAESATFSRRLVEVRLAADPDMRDKVVERMAEAANDPSTRRLMQTPLQVTIMSLIVEKYPNLPPDRFTLFDLYYKTIFDREVGKDIPVARFLAENRQQIDRLHETVGLRLQVLAESEDRAEAVLPVEELTELVSGQLLTRGFDPEVAAADTKLLVDAAMSRLVLLVPRDWGVGFEVRTLQEMMAARALTSATDEQIADWLKLTAHHPHWRNTWLLAAGRLLASSERFEGVLVQTLRSLDIDPRRLSAVYLTAPSLAGALLDDNLAHKRPAFETALVQIVLTQLSAAPLWDSTELAHSILRLLFGSQWTRVVERLKRALAGDQMAQASALVLIDRLLALRGVPHRGTINAVRNNATIEPQQAQTVRRFIEATHGAVHDAISPTQLGAFFSSLQTSSGSDVGRRAVEEAFSFLNRTTVERLGSGRETYLSPVEVDDMVDPSPLLGLLSNESDAMSLEMALQALPPREWAAISLLGPMFLPELNRLPVGPQLWDEVSAAQAAAAQY
jgi:hypothetical protein